MAVVVENEFFQSFDTPGLLVIGGFRSGGGVHRVRTAMKTDRNGEDHFFKSLTDRIC